jgi:putative ATP-binding cassette transporter
MAELRFDKRALKRFFALSGPFFTSDLRWWAIGLLSLLAALAIINSLMGVLMSYINRDFMTALSLKESDEFLRHLGRYLLVFACALPFNVFYSYTEQRLALIGRKWLSHRILKHYFANHAFYKINSYDGIDNPDQRIEEDIRSFSANSLSILLIIFRSIIDIVAFIGILYSISLNLVFAVLAYAAFGSLFTYLLGRPLIGLDFDQLRKEADYRYKLVNIRDNAESIAFYRDEGKEFTRVRQCLRNALRNMVRIIDRSRTVNFFTTSYNFLIHILPIVIVAPLYLHSEIEFGEISQAAGAFVQVVNALSVVVLNFRSFTGLTAVVTRLGAFWEALEDSSKDSRDSKGPRITLKRGSHIIFKNVTIMTPRADQTIIDSLNLDLTGKSLFISGVSGTGKSSILRVLSGLWTSGKGELTRPAIEDIMFLPQRPYLMLGSFRSQFLYGIHDQGLRNAEINDVIERVGLKPTLLRVGGLNAVKDWPNLLSTGEQQRVAFGRLLLAKPKFAILDEATTALDEVSELALYKELFAVSKSVVSVGYRPALSAMHSVHLELLADQKWKIERGDP